MGKSRIETVWTPSGDVFFRGEIHVIGQKCRASDIDGDLHPAIKAGIVGAVFMFLLSMFLVMGEMTVSQESERTIAAQTYTKG